MMTMGSEGVVQDDGYAAAGGDDVGVCVQNAKMATVLSTFMIRTVKFTCLALEGRNYISHNEESLLEADKHDLIMKA